MAGSGAQLLAEISRITKTTWSTLRPPAYLPDDVDGRVLFNVATAKYKAQKEGRPFDASLYNLSDIVMVPPVVDARERGVLHSKGRFIEMTEDGVIWESGEKESFDVIVWCTGFSSATAHLRDLGVINDEDKPILMKHGQFIYLAFGYWVMATGPDLHLRRSLGLGDQQGQLSMK